ncbi:MAG: hypothetical protein OHK0013_36580 [Sandaracinaceae bacterium]
MRRAPVGPLTLVLVLGGCGHTEAGARDPALSSQAPRRAASGPTSGGEPPRAATRVDAEAREPTAPAVPSTEVGGWWDAYADRPALDTLEGRASFYADSLAGRPTASGEPYDPGARTAASRTLPFGTVLRVIRMDTGASVIVRVNDRGPFGDRRRVLDLSRAAAEALDMVRRGVVEVQVEILERP